MTTKDRDYFMLRARQEREAARSSTNRVVRNRHEELAGIYQMRIQFSDREDLATEKMIIPMPGPAVG